ncbi:bifunctional 2-C-methyl-D-erythritol 4-phosphate cytidylyltransferase/2-C-methyl-D-erythritol 2,4-cyclodiphosphate synthase [Hirschia maritima]|uniref:bifunctional 2-C-methyl-D-erythritol 4-phosphate cytidylyltransferase/2-C-methyl-D-erythritol 2,4-cyclodiphosphate synthase n=1 Tax=Hirschia maritima TaxID=1121961 RepID=UPI0003A1DB6E|nr:bifunctional 2-C-methyl-D-erythritol 4-phosphate cytidylyltransferase/2-C-methyl-D-erythritol 2,4-cyclodiphosphate synthase [Hirschia maritima]
MIRENCIAVVVAAGNGTRSGRVIPKQFADINGKPILEWSIQSLSKDKRFKKIIVVVSEEFNDLTSEICAPYSDVEIVSGGVERADSVRKALSAAQKHDPDSIFIHDAARPGLTQRVIDDLFTALEKNDAAAPALPIVDAIKQKSSIDSLKNIDRTDLFRIQTPQAFKFQKILSAQQNKKNFVDDLEAIEGIGGTTQLVSGEYQLMKVTLPEDFETVSKLMRDERSGLIGIPRIGSGFDVHQFEEGDFVILCGVKIPHIFKLKGHSDADVAWHALTDAIYGALAEGDIGVHFPPTEPKWEGVASEVFLKHAVDLARERGFKIGNVDFTIICEEPKLKPHNIAMREETARVLGIPLDRISVKATTTEKLGFTGRKEGIAAQANVLLVS